MGEKGIKGYKIFQPDWTCRGMKFEVGKVYEEDITPECCKQGIHFCLKLEDCFIYYEFNKQNKVAEVLALGEIDLDSKNSKCSTNKIQIIRELDWQEVMDLLKIERGYKIFPPDWHFYGQAFQVGKIYQEDVLPKYCEKGFHYCLDALDCLDYCNYGEKGDYKFAEVLALGEIDFYALGRKCCTNKIKIIKELNWYDILCLSNIGRQNTGKQNQGNWNTGDYNIGEYNTGNKNYGNWNTGSSNHSNRNVGRFNASNPITNYYNIITGNNTGNYNTGGYNTSDYNIGNWNTANWNVGNHNTGEHNIGNHNTGNYNRGNRNTGDFNTTNDSNGYFNTVEPKLYLFNKPSDWTHKIWIKSKANHILSRIRVTEWIPKQNMTVEEQQNHPECHTIGGYLKQYSFYEACQIWWKTLTNREKTIIQAIPNFDAAIFKEITGIDVKETEI